MSWLRVGLGWGWGVVIRGVGLRSDVCLGVGLFGVVAYSILYLTRCRLLVLVAI